ncbi:MAG: phosphate acyltransferase [bacterium]
MRFIESIFEKVRKHPKRVVFADGELPLIVKAAGLFYQNQLGIPILLGRRDVIEEIAARESSSLDHVAIIDPETSSELPVFCRRLERMERYRKAGLTDSRSLMVRPSYFAAMMIQYGLADALVGGADTAGGALLRPLLHLVKPLPFADVISSCTIVELHNRSYGDDGVLFFADTGVVPDPTMAQLATITVQAGLLARQVFGRRPRIALLSFSTKGSARTASTEKVAGAVALARHIAEKADVEMTIDGEMQADAALEPALAEIKLGESNVGGKANVLIFPDLNSGNIAVKLTRLFADSSTYGQILMGFTRPAVDLSRGATAEDILGMAAIVALQAIEYRKLYPPA